MQCTEKRQNPLFSAWFPCFAFGVRRWANLPFCILCHLSWADSRPFCRDGCGQKTFSQKYFVVPEPVAKNALAANNPVFRKPAILVLFYGLPPTNQSPGRTQCPAPATSARPFATRERPLAPQPHIVIGILILAATPWFRRRPSRGMPACSRWLSERYHRNPAPRIPHSGRSASQPWSDRPGCDFWPRLRTSIPRIANPSACCRQNVHSQKTSKPP